MSPDNLADTLLDTDTLSRSYAANVDDADIGQLTISMSDEESNMERDSAVVEQLAELAANLESIRQTLNEPNELTSGLARVAVESMSKDWGTQIHYSEESLGTTLKQIGIKIKEVAIKIWNAFMRFIENIVHFLKPYRLKLEAINSRAKKLKAENAKSKTDQVELPKSLQHAFQVNGRTIPNIADMVRDEENGLLTRLSKFADGYARVAGNILENANEAAAKGEYTRLLQYVDSASNIVHTSLKGGGTETRPKAGGTITTMSSIPGNRTLTVQVLAIDNTSTASMVNSIGKLDIKIHDNSEKYAPTLTLPVMTPDEIIAVANAGFVAVALMDGHDRVVKQLNNAKRAYLNRMGVIFDNPTANRVVTGTNSVRAQLAHGVSRYFKNALKVCSTWLSLNMALIRDTTTVAKLSLDQY